MCKKNWMKSIKNVSKIIPSKVNNITIKTIEKAKNVYQQVNVKDTFNKTKEELKQKQKQFEQIAKKANQTIKQKKEQLIEKKQSIAKSASDYKQKIIDSNIINQKKQAMHQYKEKIKQGIKQKQEAASKSASDILKSTIDYKNKIMDSNIINEKKQIISGYAEKIKDKAKQNTYSVVKAIKSIAPKPQQQKKLIVHKEQLTQKTQVQNKVTNKSLIQQLTPNLGTANKQSNKPKSDSSFSYYAYLFDKLKYAHQYFFTRAIVKTTKNIFSKTLTNIYWRLIFGACLIVFVYQMSANLPRQLRIYYSEKNKLQKQKKEATIQQKVEK